MLHLTEIKEENGLPGVPATVVFGAEGFVGSNILAGLRKANPGCLGAGRRSGGSLPCLDLVKPDIRPLGLQARGITHAVIAAGIAGIVACEKEPEATRAVNVCGTAELARQLACEGIRVVALSSDYVFDGVDGNYLESSPVNPLNEYGRQKVAMESSLLGCDGCDILVVRLSKVFDLRCGSGTLLDEMAGKMVRVVPVATAHDQIFCPTHIDDVAAIMQRLLASDLSGIVHLCAPEAISRLQLARRVADIFGCDQGLVHAISLTDLGEMFERPLNTSMACHLLAERFPYRFRTLDACIEELGENYLQEQGGQCQAWPE